MYPISLCFCKVLLVNSLQSGKAWQERAQEPEKSHYHTKKTKILDARDQRPILPTLCTPLVGTLYFLKGTR